MFGRIVLLSLIFACSMGQMISITVFQPKLDTLTPTKASQLAALDSAAKVASESGSILLMVPELYLTGYNLAAASGAEPAYGASYKVVSGIAARHNVSILFTYPEDGGNGAIFDAAALIYRNGSTLASYRKVNLAAGENAFFTPGDQFAPIVDLDGVKVGILICFDIFLPEPARILAIRGAQMILIPTANGYPPGIRNQLSDLIVPTRALENNAITAYVNWLQDIDGSPAYLHFYGQTKVADWGGSTLYSGPAADSALQQVSFNISQWPGPSTASSRPAADLKGLCGNFSH